MRECSLRGLRSAEAAFRILYPVSKLAMNLQPIIFIVGFLIILGLFIAFIRTVSARLSGKIPPGVFEFWERVIIGGIVLGVISMFQPWVFIGYKYGFLLVLFSTLAFIVWSHVTPALSESGFAGFEDAQD
jgi:hypothetical protein